MSCFTSFVNISANSNFTKMKFTTRTAAFFILIHSCLLSGSMGSPPLTGKDMDDFNLTTVEIIEKHGYPAETHTTETEDGYILVLHRIPHGKNSTTRGYPILLDHSFLFDSSGFLMHGQKSLGFFLADEGYDVWLGNFRGNHYTRTHKNLSSEDSKFWDFSLHEHGVYDLPAHIRYVCNKTENKEILYLGYSMSGTAFFIMASERPEYQKKIRGAVLLAPVASLKYSSANMRFFFVPAMNLIQSVSKPGSFGDAFQDSDTVKNFFRFACNSSFIHRRICRYAIALMGGLGSKVFDEKTVMNLASHASVTSSKVVEHYAQLFQTSKFRQFDYGPVKNLARYNQSSPPEYNLESITTRTGLMVSLNDIFATPKNIFEAFKGVRTVKGFYVVPEPSFTHMDFIAGNTVTKTVYPVIASWLRNFISECGVIPQDIK